MSDYTPTTEDVLEDYAIGRNEEVGAGWYDQHRAEFSRWLATHDAAKRAEWEAEQGETEWEYGRVGHFVADGRDAHDDAALIDRRTAEVNVRLANDGEKDEPPIVRVHYTLARRRAGSKPGPWESVPDTTNNESEDEK